MKKFIVFIALLGAYIITEAQSMLKVSLTDRSVINVSVDGRYFNKKGSSITVGDLPPGKHHVEVYEVAPDRWGRARENMIYQGKVRTTAGAITLFVFDPNSGQTDIQDQDMNTYIANNPVNTAPQQQDNMGQGQHFANNNSGNYGNGYDNNTQYNGNNGDQPLASPVKMGSLTDDKISTLKSKVAAKDADLQKIDVLKNGLKGETYTTDQVSTMMGWLVFEESKVTFAEWAYSGTVDKDNFRSLENQFSYKNSQDDLDKFLQGQK